MKQPAPAAKRSPPFLGGAVGRNCDVGDWVREPEGSSLLLIEHEVQAALEQAKSTFSNFTDWEYNNETNDDYFGFSLWGQFILNLEDQMPRRFFITLDSYEENWNGHLTIGQPCYLWSSADVGDAHLLDTESCRTLEDAIAALKVTIENLFRAFSST